MTIPPCEQSLVIAHRCAARIHDVARIDSVVVRHRRAGEVDRSQPAYDQTFCIVVFEFTLSNSPALASRRPTGGPIERTRSKARFAFELSNIDVIKRARPHHRLRPAGDRNPIKSVCPNSPERQSRPIRSGCGKRDSKHAAPRLRSSAKSCSRVPLARS